MTDSEYQQGLSREREAIDRIDKQLLPLFLERMGCVERVGELKKAFGAPVLNQKREEEILARVRREAAELGHPELGDTAAQLFQAMMAVSRAREHGLITGESHLRELEKSARRTLPRPVDRVVCQGVRGAYSHQAARSLFGEAAIDFVPDFPGVFREVDKGALGVLPVENSAAGSVTAVYDLILKYRFFIVGAVDISIEHCLAAPKGTEPSSIRRVVSHPQALSQCAEFIRRQGLEEEPYSNTAAAAERIAHERRLDTAAICSAEAAERYGLDILCRGVQDEKNNTTRFVAISKEAVLPEDANKISLCFSLPHTTGSLHNVLQRFAQVGLNLTKIESRPIPQRRFEYDFYLDFTGSIHNADTLELICALDTELPRFSFLGNYPEAGVPQDVLSREAFQLTPVETESQIQELCAVAEKVWHLTYDHLLAPGQVDYMVERFQSPNAVKEQMAHEGYRYYALMQGGKTLGFTGFSPRYEGREELFLSKIYLLPEARGQGAVAQIMALIEGEARAQNLPSIRLTVNKENTHAAGVYRHYGFETVDSVVTDIGRGYVMDDYIMVKKLV